MGTTTTKKSFEKPDETREFGRGKAQILNVPGYVIGKTFFEPGWRWSEHVKPIAKTESCQVHHTGYVLQGRMVIRMDDGSQTEIGPGDVFVCPPGHDAWVVGNETCIALDISGAQAYAKNA